MSTKKTTSKKKTATTKRGRRKKPATSSLFKTGTGSSSDREARDWQDILGAEAKAALDAKMKRGEAATMLSPAAALYWYSLQESMRTDGEPRSTRPLLTVARSIRDGETVRQELAAALNVPNVYEKRQRKLNSDRGRRSREMKLKWTNAEYVPTWVAAVHKAGGPWKRGRQLTVILQYVQRKRRTQNAITLPSESVLSRS